jgi:hypothetical protein
MVSAMFQNCFIATIEVLIAQAARRHLWVIGVKDRPNASVETSTS